MAENLMTISFLVIMVPALIMLAMMVRTNWWRTESGEKNLGGRIIVGLLAVTFTSSAASLFVLLLPDAAQADAAQWVRIGIRMSGGVAMWLLLITYIRVQRQGTRETLAERSARHRRRHDDPSTTL